MADNTNSPSARSGVARGMWRGLLIALFGLAMVLFAMWEPHSVVLKGQQRTMSDFDVVGAVVPDPVKRPPWVAPPPGSAAQPAGQPDCPT